MKCVRPCCRKEIPDGASFCPWCGKKQPEAAPQQRKKRRRPKGSGSVYKLSGTRAIPYVRLHPKGTFWARLKRQAKPYKH